MTACVFASMDEVSFLGEQILSFKSRLPCEGRQNENTRVVSAECAPIHLKTACVNFQDNLKENNLGPGNKIRYIWGLKGPIFIL